MLFKNYIPKDSNDEIRLIENLVDVIENTDNSLKKAAHGSDKIEPKSIELFMYSIEATMLYVLNLHLSQ